MEDFIFGTLATDALKTAYYRTTKQGIRHANRMFPQKPLSSQPITLHVDIGPDVNINNLVCYYTEDGSTPEGSHGTATTGKTASFNRTKIEWDTLTWGYASHWEAEISVQHDTKAIKYIISGWSDDGSEVYADWPNVKLTSENFAKYFFEGKPLPKMAPMGNPQEPTIFQINLNEQKTPQWFVESVIYHIFVDRFFPGEGKNWKQTQKLDESFGGTLWGIAEKLDYLESLGVTALWLSPIFPSPTVHRYDAIDYYHVAEDLGGDQALHELVWQAHKKGIRIILDFVCNHISSEHPYFQQALSNPNSKYRDWFYFDEKDAPGYRTFFGVKTMPQLNLNHPEARQWMLDIATYWIESFDVDGYRLDHAMGPELNFWNTFWETCKVVKADSICLGEVVEPPNVQEQFYGRMDGLLDFHLCEAIRRSIGLSTWPKDRFLSFLKSHHEFFPDDFVMATFLDNHDMDRFLFITDNDKNALREASSLQFNLPGPPIIYYGTEVGLEQTVSKTTKVGLEASRGPMAWGEGQDKNLFTFYQDLIGKRKKSKPWQKRGI
jgi:cyclomaltodextrinase / maltogenic alpha-amylase / neopullulanase